MNWLWWREAEDTPRPQPVTAGERAHAEALANLADARAKGPEVNRVAASLKELRVRNHFSEQIDLLMQGGRP